MAPLPLRLRPGLLMPTRRAPTLSPSSVLPSRSVHLTLLQNPARSLTDPQGKGKAAEKPADKAEEKPAETTEATKAEEEAKPAEEAKPVEETTPAPVAEEASEPAKETPVASTPAVTASA